MFQFLGMNGFVEAIKNYIEIKVELVKLTITEYFAAILSKVIGIVIVFVLFLFFLLFFSIFLAVSINLALENTIIGWLIVSLIYLLFFIISLRFFASGRLSEMIEKRSLETTKIDEKIETLSQKIQKKNNDEKSHTP
ncbi:MAG: hypothetical protein QM536_02185 [Chitinophagaceae bacterium]|nr:hypothetical protein [Chitinophagaceae bacterium]